MYNKIRSIYDIKVSIMEQISIQELAHWFLNKESMTHKKLQKICYYAVAWGWALMDRNLITDDRFEAWVHGPVAPALYEAYKPFSWNDIPRVDSAPSVANATSELFESVWLTYGDQSGNELEALSHSEKPWIEARGSLKPDQPSHNPISTTVMRDFYNSIKETDF